MRKLLILVYISIFMFIISCAGLGVKLSDNSNEVLQKSATSTVGYLIAKNNPKYIDDMVTWYNVFNNADTLGSVQESFQEGMGKLSQLISDDPYLQLQVKNLSGLIQIDYNGPQLPEEVEKYKDVVDSFMDGVMTAKSIS